MLINATHYEREPVMTQKTMSTNAAPVVNRMPITKARINLGAVVKRVHLTKEYVILEKDGIPIAGVMDIDEFEDYLELQDPGVRQRIRKSREAALAGDVRPARDFIAQLRKEAQQRTKRRSKR
jgi:PHD/YefM family antitoxin component YafN of YafNO toxin-antitoxin module